MTILCPIRPLFFPFPSAFELADQLRKGLDPRFFLALEHGGEFAVLDIPVENVHQAADGVAPVEAEVRGDAAVDQIDHLGGGGVAAVFVFQGEVVVGGDDDLRRHGAVRLEHRRDHLEFLGGQGRRAAVDRNAVVLVDAVVLLFSVEFRERDDHEVGFHVAQLFVAGQAEGVRAEEKPVADEHRDAPVVESLV